MDELRLARAIRAKLEHLPGLFSRHIPVSRQLLRKILEGHILCEPIDENGKTGYRFTATGTFDRLLTGSIVGNDGGGGHPFTPSLTDAIFFDIQGVARVARQAV